MVKQLYFQALPFDDFLFSIVVSEQGLSYLSLHGETPTDYRAYFASKGIEVEISVDEGKTIPYIKELTEYLAGKRQVFTLPLDYLEQGTPFQQEVWQALLDIPYGQSSSYSQLAVKINRPKAYRAVGSAVGKNPLSLVVPCHRILRQDGGLGGYGGGLPLKEKLLKNEGINWH